MRSLRISVTVLFAAVLAVFIVFTIQERSADTTFPVITMDSDILHVSIHTPPEDFLSGVTAYDEKDGDITDKIIVESISRFTEPGVSVIKYAVCDNDNHVTSVSRKISYTDYTSPRFTLSDSLIFGISENIDIRRILGAHDAIDGNITGKVIITADEYSSGVPGVYYISAKATNSRGDMITLKLPVYVEEKSLSAPVIELEQYLVYLKAGEEFDIAGNLLSAAEQDGSDLTDSVQIDTNLDPDVPGLYEIHYSTADDAGRVGHSITTVIVEE